MNQRLLLLGTRHDRCLKVSICTTDPLQVVKVGVILVQLSGHVQLKKARGSWKRLGNRFMTRGLRTVPVLVGGNLMEATRRLTDGDYLSLSGLNEHYGGFTCDFMFSSLYL